MSLDPRPSDAALARMAQERISRTPHGRPLSGAGSVPVLLPAADQAVLILPWSVLHTENGMFTLVGKRYRAAMAAAKTRAVEQYPRAPMTGPVAVFVHLYVPNRQRRDAANYLKLLLDVPTGIVYADDSQALGGGWRVSLDVDRPRAEVTITRDPTLTLEGP